MTLTYYELNQTQEKQRDVLIAFSKELRERNGDGESGASDVAMAALQEKDADLIYLQKKKDEPIPAFHGKTTLDVINHIRGLNIAPNDYETNWFKTFANPAQSFDDLVNAAGAAPLRPPAAAAAVASRRSPARPPARTPAAAAAPPPPPSAAGGREGEGDGDEEGEASTQESSPINNLAQSLQHGFNNTGVFLSDCVRNGAGGAIGFAASVVPATNGIAGALRRGKGVDKALTIAGNAISKGVDAGIEAYRRPTAPAAVAGGGGGGGGGAAAGVRDGDADDAGDGAGADGGGALPPAAPAPGDDTPALAAATPNPGAEEEELKKLQAANPGVRLQVFDADNNDDAKKKKKYDAQLETIFANDDNYKKNKDSAFKCFVSLSEEPGKNGTLLPNVTKTDFLKILEKKSFAGTADKYAVACKMELGKGEKIMMGRQEIGDQCFIDVNDKLNNTRIFLSKENFRKLEEYKKNLVKEFKELLGKNDQHFKGNGGRDLTKTEIENRISEFNSITQVFFAIGGAPAAPAAPAPAPAPAPDSTALPTDSLASIVGLTSVEQIDEYARKLADNFLQRKFIKGDLSVEAKNDAGAGSQYNSPQQLGHIKIVRPKTDNNRIKVYKVGSDDDAKNDYIGLKHINLAISTSQIMQIDTSKITDQGVTGVKYYKSDGDNNFNKEIEKKDLDDAKKAKVDVFVVDSTNKEMMTRLKIRNGDDKSKNKGRNANEIVTPLSGEAPKIFTLGSDRRIKIGEGTIYLPFKKDFLKTDIYIKKDNKGNLKIKYGDNKCSCCSCLSRSKGGWLFNTNFTSVEGVGESFILQKEKKWNPFNPNLLRTEERKLAVQFQVLDPDTDKISTVEIRKVGSRNGFGGFFCAWRARNELEVKVASKVKEVPKTIFDPQTATSVAPTHSPGLAKVK